MSTGGLSSVVKAAERRTSAIGSEVRGFKPGRGRWIFQSVKILSITSIGREVKPWVRVVNLRHVKEPQAEITVSEQNLSDFSRSL